jgi:hypothetical protein
VTSLERKLRRRRYPKLGEKILTTTFAITPEDGVQRFFWFLQPDGMTQQQAFETQEIHGPFKTEEEADEDLRVTIMGPQCKVTYGGQWDPAWDKLQ